MPRFLLRKPELSLLKILPHQSGDLARIGVTVKFELGED